MQIYALKCVTDFLFRIYKCVSVFVHLTMPDEKNNVVVSSTFSQSFKLLHAVFIAVHLL